MPAPIGAEDLYRFRWIDHVRLSRDGERVAYQLSWADAESRQNRSRVVVRRLLDQEPVEATAGPRRDHSPEWSPDGGRLAFLARRGATDQLFVLEVASGATKQLSSTPDGVFALAWSPDGKWIAFIGSVIGDLDAVVDDPRPPESRDQARRAPVARIARRLDYKHDGQGYADGRYRHLFVVPAEGGDVTQLTGGPWDVTGFDWSPDSTRLVVSGNADPGADLRRELNLYLVDLAGTRDKLTGGFYLSSPSWSPRGDFIAFVAPNGLGAGLLERLWIVPSSGGPARCLTVGFDHAVGDSVATDMRAGHSVRVKWSEAGDRVFFTSSSPGVSGINSTDLEGSVRSEVGGQRGVFDFDVASGAIAFCATDPTSPGELHVVTNGAEARLTDLNPWLRERYIAQPERHSFTSPDGWVIEGWLLKPQDFDATRRYPLVMEIHGGPHAQYGWAFFHEFQVLAGMGYLVLYTNPRGSDGYGEHFRRQVVRDWGGKDYIDLMSALDQLIERTGYVDAGRMGVGGGSYGGYMTNWIIGQTDRFAAAIAMRSVSNLVSEYAQNDIVIWGVLELGPPPWPDLDELWKRSPIRYVQNIKTPLLLTAGEMDLRCAISQSEELFGAMRLLGKTVEMVRFPEESHDLSRGGRPDRRVERLKRITGWYERFLGTAPAEPDSEQASQVLEAKNLAPVQAMAEIADEETMQMETIAAGPVPAVEAPAVEAELETGAADTTVLETMALGVVVPETMDLAVVEEEPTELAIVEAEPDASDIGVWVAEPESPAPEAAPVEREAVEPDYAAVAEPEPAMPDLEADAEPAAEAHVQPARPEAPVEPLGAEPLLAAEPAREEQAVAAAEPVLEVSDLLPVLPEPEPIEFEPAAATPEPEVMHEPEGAAEAEPVAQVSEPEPEAPQPVAAVPEPEPPAPEPEPAVPEPLEAAQAAPPEPEPAPAAAAPTPESAAPNPVAETIIAWPTGSIPGGPGNGAPDPTRESSEAATSLIPIWQPAGPDPKQTVSLEALPPETVKAGTGYVARLTFESGPFAGRVVALPSQMVTVGRAPDNDVVVGDPATSGRHGRIEVRGGVFWISDLGSTNGTMVNGEPIIERQLADGDLIAIGQNAIRFTLEQ
jgi:dipeptidyl aminopeptidase/acylaminoacyl peptidase